MLSSSVPKDITVRPLVVGKSSILESLERSLGSKALAEIINKAAAPIAQHLTKDLQEDAKSRIEWRPYAPYLTVVFENLRFRIRSAEDEQIQQAIHKLEYGLLEEPPRPLLRPFQTKIEKAYERLARDVSKIVVPNKKSITETIITAVLRGSNNA